MRRIFPLSAAAGLSLTTAGCAPGKAEIEIIDEDGDGLDDDFGWGDGDGDGDGGDDPDSPDGEPDEPDDDPGDDPDDDPDDEPDAGTLAGDWALTAFDGYSQEYTYEGERCTYFQSWDLAMSFEAEGGGEYRGAMFIDYTWWAEGDDCPYSGQAYSGSERYSARGESEGGRSYEIRVRDWDLQTSCELDGDELDCDVGMRFERE